ncbi:MAG: UDP-N-acetylmuramoyl-tripeptide--D-alanyl-D-alanine ligase [Chitinivibrionales bacterium]
MDIETLYKRFRECGTVSTDTRQVETGALFIALRGNNFDANEFAAEALDKGAKYAVIDDPRYCKDSRFIVVENTLTTLQCLSRHHRRQFDIPVIGINGSNGKTTTKELLNAVLSRKYKVLVTRDNLNNHIGVPLTLLGLNTSHELAVIELGANRIGEIASLCDIAEPTHGLTTNIGKAHLEGFGGLDGAIRGEGELYRYLEQTGGTVFVNSRNEILKNLTRRIKTPISYPGENDYFTCRLIDADPYITYSEKCGKRWQTHLIGRYNFENIAAALCIGKFFEIPAEEANKSVVDYVPENKRSQVIDKESNTIILDAYNANPDSMQEAIRNMEMIKASHKIVILGDMYELGEYSPQEHAAIGRLLRRCHFQDIFLCGKDMEHAYKFCSQAQYFENKQRLEQHLNTRDFAHATILLKASRAMTFDTIVDLL